MEQTTKEVTNVVQPASAEHKGVDTSSPAPENDPEVKLAALLEENKKLTRDRDNYRDGLLALKGKKDIEDLDLSDPVQFQAYFDKKFDEKVAASRGEQSQQELETYTKELARKNKELTLALQNRSQGIGAGMGSGATGQESANAAEYFSPEQKAALEKRWSLIGISKDKFPDMLKTAERRAKGL